MKRGSESSTEQHFALSDYCSMSSSTMVVSARVLRMMGATIAHPLKNECHQRATECVLQIAVTHRCHQPSATKSAACARSRAGFSARYTAWHGWGLDDADTRDSPTNNDQRNAARGDTLPHRPAFCHLRVSKNRVVEQYEEEHKPQGNYLLRLRRVRYGALHFLHHFFHPPLPTSGRSRHLGR